MMIMMIITVTTMTTPMRTQQSFALEHRSDADRFRHATTILCFVMLMTMMNRKTFPLEQKHGDDDDDDDANKTSGNDDNDNHGDDDETTLCFGTQP